MLDIQFIRDNPDLVKEKALQKGYDIDVQQLLGFDIERRDLLGKIEELRQSRNQLAAQSKGSRPTPEQVEEGRRIKEDLSNLEHQQASIEQEYIALLKKVPNMPADDVPIGKSEDDNINGEPKGRLPEFDFEPKTHWQIGEAKAWIDKERAAKVTGSRFAYIKGDLVALQMAIVQFVINSLTNRELIARLISENNLNLPDTPFTPILPPVMIRESVYDQMDRLEPREDRYHIDGADDNLWLIGSAEHTLGSMYADEILSSRELPLRYVGYSTSFRQEAGTYGKDNEGILRMHQFDKLELEVFSTAETGPSEHLLTVAIQEYLVQQLGIPYRVVTKCTADIGKPNARGIDIEAWLPGQNKFRETHTADYMSDYQARRLKTRYRVWPNQDTQSEGVGSQEANLAIELVHTNDATAFAMGRTMIAIIENFQTKEGDVIVPEVLRPYLSGRDKI